MSSEILASDHPSHPRPARRDLLAGIRAAASQYSRAVAAAREAGLGDSAIVDASVDLPDASTWQRPNVFDEALLEAQRSEVEWLATTGLTENQIAARLGISCRRIREWTADLTVR
ncbi:hypothetical protein [Microlunatus speluncae]|uniref:hypothetical protein n=1 Tax=Microlunatus speluncae TaxID=2594267 RepID=UPI001266805C|nr:hypothetical protein [Microlunatus speluncae]